MAETADRTFQINGQDVRVSAFGDPSDPPVLLLPSMLDPASADGESPTWSDDLCTGLAGGSRYVVRYEYSSRASLPTLPGLAVNVLAILDAAGLPAAHLVARRADTLIGGLLANEDPERVMSVTGIAADAPDGDAVRDILDATAPDAAKNGQSAQRGSDGDGPAGFFEALYQASAGGQLQLPWDRPVAHPLLIDWVWKHEVTGEGRRAVVVGCGTGIDAEYVANLGFDTVGFDVAQTAISLAKRQHPDSAVWYTTADLFGLPPQWRHAFDLVVEIYTVQALPDPPRADAIANVAQLVAPGGTLLAIAFVGDRYKAGGTPPWPLTREEIDAFAADGLTPVSIETLTYSGSPNPVSAEDRLWRAEFRRPRPDEG